MTGLIILPYTTIDKETLKGIIQNVDLVIGVDGGCAITYDYGLTPDLIVGDFDSLDHEILNYYKESGIEVITLKEEKDLTDGEAAIIEGLKKGCDKLILCAPSYFEETDHLIGNIFLLKKYNMCKLINEREIISFSKPGDVIIDKIKGEKVSFIPLMKSEIKIQGFKYDGTFNVDIGDSLTMRNEIVDEKAYLEVLKGEILIIQGFKSTSMV